MNYENLPNLEIKGNTYIPRIEIGRGGKGAIFTYKSVEGLKKVIAVKIPIIGGHLINNIDINNVPEEYRKELRNELNLIRNSFNYEAKLMSELNKENKPDTISSFPTLLDYNKYTPYIAMNYENGKDLEFIVENLKGRGEFLSFPQILHISKKLYGAVKRMHELGYVHNDIKLQNIRVKRVNKIKSPDDKTNGSVVLLDLGISLPIGTISDSERIGTIIYSSPELDQKGKLTPASDSYSLGLNLFELITGKNNILDLEPIFYQRKIKEEEIEGMLKDIETLKQTGNLGNYKLIDGYNNIPDKTPEEIKDLIKHSLNPNPEKRPTIDDALQTFDLVGKKYNYPKITDEELIKSLEPYMLTRLPKSREYRQYLANKKRMVQGAEPAEYDSKDSGISMFTSTSN